MFEFYRNTLTYEKSYEVFRKIIQEVRKELGEKDNEVSDVSLGTMGKLKTPTHIEEVIPQLREIFNHVPNFTEIVANVLNIKSYSQFKLDNLKDVILLDKAVIYNDILFFENPLSTVAQNVVSEKNHYDTKDLLFSEIGIIDQHSLDYIKTVLNDNINSQSKVTDELHFRKKFNDLIQWAIENKASSIKIYPNGKTFKSSLMIDGMFYNKYIKELGELSDYNEFIKNVKEFFDEQPSTRFKYSNSYFKSVLKASYTNDFIENKEVLYLTIDEMTELDYHLDNMNLNEKDKEILSTHLKAPSGVIIISGNNESGKSTTLLSMLEKIKSNKKSIDIISFENFISKKVNGVDQFETGQEAFDDELFAKNQHSIYKSNHSVIGINAISEQSIEKAFSLSQQGKLVILTVNSSSIFNTINILSSAISDKYKIVENLLCLVHVGLIRKVCKSCSTEKEFSLIKESPYFLSLANVPSTTEKVKVHHPHGCHECNDGYQSRLAVAELIDNDKIARESFINNDLDRLRLEKRASNWRSVYESAMELLKDKKVTLDSIIESMGIYRKH